MSKQARGEFRSGFVALVGRPNVGKSSLLNRLLGQKISIVTHKPQTTQQRLLGIHSLPAAQIAFIDTPGIHRLHRRAINRQMNQQALGAFDQADHIVLVTDAGRWSDEDDLVVEHLRRCRVPVGLAVNKADTVHPREALLPVLARQSAMFDFAYVVPVSARRGSNLPALLDEITRLLPPGEPMFPEDQITDRSSRYLAAELTREQLLRFLHQEVPYGIAVQIEQFIEGPTQVEIHALIWVERESHKPLVIGQGGEQLKRIGTAARRAIAALLDRPVHLELWVKVRPGWADDSRSLRELGFDG